MAVTEVFGRGEGKEGKGKGLEEEGEGKGEMGRHRRRERRLVMKGIRNLATICTRDKGYVVLQYQLHNRVGSLQGSNPVVKLVLGELPLHMPEPAEKPLLH